ncbi:hypothetical protein [Variovorax sp. LjRoot178]|uniref:hypothetical protein n=1 Tax=Variovorax sp. LjRoot178 TaxID=3342277 RepID=UPI003ECE86ED
MSSMIAFTRSFLLRSAVAAIALGGLAGCGGGGGGGGGGGVFVPVQQPVVVVAPLTLVLTRVGPEAVEVEWSDDPLAASFLVLRDGFALARVTSTSLIDASVFFNNTYCYQVEGHDATGQLVAASSSGCITII